MSDNSQLFLEKGKLMQRQLQLLFHAHKCQKSENENANGQNANKCTHPHCETMKNVLNHLNTCNSMDCSVLLCSSSRQLIAHWKNCYQLDCPICSPLKPLCNCSQTNAPIIMQPNDFEVSASEIADILKHMSLNSSLQNQTSNVFEANDSNNLASVLNHIPNDETTKEWHSAITSDLRNHLVHKLVQAIFPSPDPAAMLDKRMHHLIAYAKKVEENMFYEANSRSEYYHLIAEKIYKIQKELEEKRQKRRENEMTLQQNASTSPTEY